MKKQNQINREGTTVQDKSKTGRFMLIAASIVLGGVLITSLQAAGALTVLDEDAVTTASGVKIDPAKHRSATFRMW